MNDTLVTLVGNVATNVEYRETATGGMARFRFAVTPRRWDRQREMWVDGRTSFYTVFAWRNLAGNLAGSVSVGEPLIVHGRLRVREEERDGSTRAQAQGQAPGQGDGSHDGGGGAGAGVARRTFVDIEAVAVGHDLTRGTSAFRRAGRVAPTPLEQSVWAVPPPSPALFGAAAAASGPAPGPRPEPVPAAGARPSSV